MVKMTKPTYLISSLGSMARMAKLILHEAVVGRLIKRNKLKIVEKKHYSESGFQGHLASLDFERG